MNLRHTQNTPTAMVVTTMAFVQAANAAADCGWPSSRFWAKKTPALEMIIAKERGNTLRPSQGSGPAKANIKTQTPIDEARNAAGPIHDSATPIATIA
jgi:hypothetical protein